jgi:hypothetical protein
MHLSQRTMLTQAAYTARVDTSSKHVCMCSYKQLSTTVAEQTLVRTHMCLLCSCYLDAFSVQTVRVLSVQQYTAVLLLALALASSQAGMHASLGPVYMITLKYPQQCFSTSAV